MTSQGNQRSSRGSEGPGRSTLPVGGGEKSTFQTEKKPGGTELTRAPFWGEVTEGQVKTAYWVQSTTVPKGLSSSEATRAFAKRGRRGRRTLIPQTTRVSEKRKARRWVPPGVGRRAPTSKKRLAVRWHTRSQEMRMRGGGWLVDFQERVSHREKLRRKKTPLVNVKRKKTTGNEKVILDGGLIGGLGNCAKERISG